MNIQSAALKLSTNTYTDNFTINAKGNYWGGYTPYDTSNDDIYDSEGSRYIYDD